MPQWVFEECMSRGMSRPCGRCRTGQHRPPATSRVATCVPLAVARSATFGGWPLSRAPRFPGIGRGRCRCAGWDGLEKSEIRPEMCLLTFPSFPIVLPESTWSLFPTVPSLLLILEHIANCSPQPPRSLSITLVPSIDSTSSGNPEVLGPRAHDIVRNWVRFASSKPTHHRSGSLSASFVLVREGLRGIES